MPATAPHGLRERTGVRSRRTLRGISSGEPVHQGRPRPFGRPSRALAHANVAASSDRDLSAAPRAFRLAIFVGVFLIAAASLAFEVLLTRIFSVMM